MAKFCRYCGGPVREGASFCKTCGAQLEAPRTASGAVSRAHSAAASRPPSRTASSRVGATAAQPKKRSPLPVIAAALALALLVTGFGWPGWLRTLIRGGGGEAVIHTVEITLPASTGVRAVVEEQAAVALEAYLVARAYYDKLEHYDLDRFDQEEYIDLLDRAATAFDIADALSAALEENAEYLSGLEEEGVTGAGTAAYRELAAGVRPGGPFAVTAYAADDNPSMKWARDITAIYDKAPVGKGVRTLAAQLGTDAKHAYAILTQAQAIISGEALAAADMYNAAYQTAVETKAAASAAGFAVAVAASGGAAAGIASALEVGGVVCSGVQAMLDVGTAVTVATTNGEGNEYTTAFENTSSQFAPISAFFALGNAGVNAYNIYKGVDVSDNKVQAVIYLANSITDYFTSDNGSLLGGTLAYNQDGLSFTLMDTLFGADPKQQEAAKQMLRQLGVDEKTIGEAVSIAAGRAESTAAPELSAAPEEEDGEDIGLGELADQYIEQYDIFTDPNQRFDKYGFIEYMRDRVTYAGNDFREGARPQIIAPGLHPEMADEEDDEPTPPPTATPQPSPTPEPEPTPNHGSGYEEGITGTYDMVIDVTSGSTFYETCEVLLHDSGKMEVSFMGEHLVGTYDPQTHTFVGMGDVFTGDPMTETFWNYYETSITFDTSTTPVTAFGIMVPELTISIDMTTYIEMKKIDG